MAVLMDKNVGDAYGMEPSTYCQDMFSKASGGQTDAERDDLISKQNRTNGRAIIKVATSLITMDRIL